MITFQADSAALLRQCDASVKAYYCADDWASSGRWWQPLAKVRKREAELVDACDLVFATSQRLAQRLKDRGKPTFFLPNAVDYELFSQAQSRSLPERIGALRRPVIGFSGVMDRHSFDAELMLMLGRRHPEWTFLIVGMQVDTKPDLAGLRALPNFVFVGFQDRATLPDYLAGMDVCVIPRAQTEWTKSAFSLKLFEYLAAGKPVIATWTEEYRPYEAFVHQAHTYDEFEKCIERALSEDSQELARRRMELARENSWDKRVSRFSEIVSDFLAGRPLGT
jgi:glycosyltransferase involved in cell wall biosynthesis